MLLLEIPTSAPIHFTNVIQYHNCEARRALQSHPNYGTYLGNF